MTRAAIAGIFLGLLAGCSSHLPAETAPGGIVLTGTVAYRERIALPADATVEICSRPKVRRQC